MSHDAIENVLSEPPTPTISSVGSELSFEDVTGSPIVGGPKEHPDLFMRDDMVTIQVEEILFRIPSYFLTQESTHFASLLENNDTSSVVHITDADVSSIAFANLLVVLRPRLGVTPISTLSEWTNVLHLSAKWGFEHLRSAAITAILPLASAVDKLVLGRTYGFVNWVPGAYTDLLKREDDLTLDEAKKMALEDVVAIAKGRREARTERIKPDVDIEEIVKSLLPVAAPEMPESDIASKDATPAVSTSAVDDIPSDQSQAHPTSADDKAKISRWVDQMTTASVRAVPQECFVKFMQEDRSRVPLVLDAILGRGLKEVSQTMETRGTLLYRSTIYGDAMADGSRHVDLRKMHNRDPPLGLINSKQTEDACLRVIVEHWHPLIDLDLAICTDSLTATPAWKSLNRAMRYLVYLNGETYLPGEGYMDPVLNSSVYAAFWIALETLYRSTHLSNQLALARWTYVLLTQFSHDASKLAVCNEMDGFYETIEETRSAAPSEHQELISVLNNIIGGRFWPSA